MTRDEVLEKAAGEIERAAGIVRAGVVVRWPETVAGVDKATGAYSLASMLRALKGNVGEAAPPTPPAATPQPPTRGDGTPIVPPILSNLEMLDLAMHICQTLKERAGAPDWRDERIKDLQRDNDVLRKEIEQSSKEIERMTTLRAELERLREELRHNRAYSGDMRFQRDDLEGEVEVLKEELARLRAGRPPETTAAESCRYFQGADLTGGCVQCSRPIEQHETRPWTMGPCRHCGGTIVPDPENPGRGCYICLGCAPESSAKEKARLRASQRPDPEAVPMENQPRLQRTVNLDGQRVPAGNPAAVGVSYYPEDAYPQPPGQR